MRHALATTAILCLGALAGLQAQDGPYHAGSAIAIPGCPFVEPLCRERQIHVAFGTLVGQR